MKSDSMGKKAAKQIDFARKHEEDLRRLRGLRLLDDDFMQKVFEDKACTELLLQIILKRADLKVLHVNGQQDIKNLQGRSVTLDIPVSYTHLPISSYVLLFSSNVSWP